jgi:hypothetical protein
MSSGRSLIGQAGNKRNGGGRDKTKFEIFFQLLREAEEKLKILI